jgi:hypothetical protein
MSKLVLEDLKRDFLEEVCTLLGPCECGSPNCKSFVFESIGKISTFRYIVEYDPSSDTHCNLLIYLKKRGDNIVFNGRCETELDVAQVLRMVII